jgi:Zn-dependent M16 (insulinase) family peptidase
MFVEEAAILNEDQNKENSLPVNVDVYIHQPSGLRVIFGQLYANNEEQKLNYDKDSSVEDNTQRDTVKKGSSSPLCSVSIVVRTPCEDNSGLPHTLEHLIFMGSEERFPHRGHLDALASRCMANGTNAYTAVDYTAYTATTVDCDSMMRYLLPAFLDHVLRPSLTEEVFTTEVVHMDPSDGKYHGVVFCEMEAREHTEIDLSERTIRRLLFSDTPYAFECGGLIADIPNLTIERIQNYHRRYYRPENMVVIVVGSELTNETKQTLFCELDYILKDDNHEKKPIISTADSFGHVIKPLGDSLSTRVYFPSDEEESGSVVLAWRGPHLQDQETCIALNILMTYLQENSASPLYQAFVERPKPLASAIDFDWLSFPSTGILLMFSGIPYRSLSGYEEWGGRSDTEDTITVAEFGDKEEVLSEEDIYQKLDKESDHSSILSEEEQSEPYDVDFLERSEIIDYNQLLKEGYFKSLVLNLFQAIIKKGFPVGPNALSKTVARSRIKLLESWEEDSHQIFIENIIISWCAMKTTTHTNDECCLAAYLRSRLNIFGIYDILERKPIQFWLDLLKCYFIQAPVIDVITLPQSELAYQYELEAEMDRERRYQSLGIDQLSSMENLLKRAMDLNQIRLPDTVLKTMPQLARYTSIPRISSHFHNRFVKQNPWSIIRYHTQDQHQHDTITTTTSTINDLKCEKNVKSYPCSSINWQIIHTTTSFCQLRLYFNLTYLSEDSRLLLVLLQSLLFESPVSIVEPNGDDSLSSPLLKHSSTRLNYATLVRQLNDTLVSYGCGVGFGNETFSCSYLNTSLIITAVCEPSKFRDMCSLVCRVLYLTIFDIDRIQTVVQNLLTDITELKRDGNEMVDALVIYKSEIHQPSNDTFLSMFAQKSFLEEISNVLMKYKEYESRKSYENNEMMTGFISKTMILIERLNRLCSNILQQSRSSLFQLVLPYGFSEEEHITIFEDIWYHHDALKRFNILEKSHLADTTILHERLSDSYGRVPYRSPNKGDIIVIVPINGLKSSSLIQVVPCDVLKHRDDQYAMHVLIQLLSRTEGPLYAGLRGRGYVYDVQMALHLWHGKLSFSMREAGCPDRALWSFYDLLRNIDQYPNTFFDDWEIETAKSCTLYQMVASQATPASVVEKISRLTFMDFQSFEETDSFEQAIYHVTCDDLIRVFRDYVLKFLPTSTTSKLILMTTSEIDAEPFCHSFAKHPNYSLKFEIESLDAQFWAQTTFHD